MAGFDGRISFEGNSTRGKQLLAGALKHANVLHESKALLGIEHAVRSYDLGGGAYCIVSDLSNMRSIHIVAPEFPEPEYAYDEPPVEEAKVGPGVYDVLAGVTDIPQLVEVEIVDKKGNVKKIDVLKEFRPTFRTATRYKDFTRRQRLAVPENPTFIPPDPPPNIRYSEHAHVKPSNFTGSMADVVQVIMGLGKILRPTYEEKLKLAPIPPIDKHYVTGELIENISGFGLYGKEGAYTPRMDFDYRSVKTQGISFDNDGIPWVIEIGFRGVQAMRLYLDPISTTKSGRRRWAQVSPELKDFLYEFGGIPLGLTIPTFELFNKFQRAGEVVQLLTPTQMEEYNGKTPMSSDTGWAFNRRGTEAHNTCWGWEDDDIKTCYHYAVGIELQQERFLKWTPNRSALSKKFHTIYEVNKCRRMKEAEAKTILNTYTTDGNEAGYQAFDALVVAPTLKGKASLSLQRSGRAYHPAKFQFQPQIKFPNYLNNGLVSFDFADGTFPKRETKKVKCDAPMYVCYINDKLEVINYFYDSTKDVSRSSSYSNSRQECQYTGSWTEVYSSAGDLGVMGNFYSNRWDFRREQMATSETTIVHHGSKLMAWPEWQQRDLFSNAFYTWTNVGVYDDTVGKTVSSKGFQISVAIPQGDRSAYYFATLEQVGGGAVSVGGAASSVQAKKTDSWSIYHRIMAWVGPEPCPESQWIDPAGLGCVMRHRCSVENPDLCFDDYTHGEFYMDACPGSGSVYGPWNPPVWPRPQLPSNYGEVTHGEGEANGDVYFINDTPYGEVNTIHLRETYDHGSSLSDWWWVASPNDTGQFAPLFAVHSCLGERTTNMMAEVDGASRNLGSPEYMYDSVTACYTGVIE